MSGGTLSEHASKQLLTGFGIPCAREALAQDAAGAVAAAVALGFPVAVKLCGDAIAHKTERGLLRLGLADADAVRAAARELLARARPEDGAVGVLVCEMVAGQRELIAGLVRDPQFGPCVMLGLGGVAAEALRDVAFAAAPLDETEARALLGRLRARKLFSEPFRGEPAGDADALARLLVNLGRVAALRPDIQSVDINPLLLRDGKPVAVDALVELSAREGAASFADDADAVDQTRASPRARKGVASLADHADAVHQTRARPRARKGVASLADDADAVDQTRARPRAREGEFGEAREAPPVSTRPVASADDAMARATFDEDALRARFAPLFAPKGIVVAGVSSHPGKFGFVVYHNLLRFGYEGALFALTRDGGEVLGRPTLSRVDEVPRGAADLLFICTPWQANLELLRAAHARGVRAAFIASGGYAEAGADGRARQRELVGVAEELGMVVAGPNGQGVIATAASMCAQIVAPYPPPGGISVASQSGNLVSSFLNYAVEAGVGVSKAISAGNSAQLALPDYLAYYAVDPETRVVLAYAEGVPDGRRFAEAARFTSARKPLVLVKGGVAKEGQRAAASHTGSLAADDVVFDGVAAQCGVLRAPDIETAYEWAATFASQPLPRGRRTVVMTTAGGWGVLAADACAAQELSLIALPEDLRAAIDERMPPRWSRSNPVDLAGGETRDTIPWLLDLLAAHDEVDAIVHLGIGIQAAQAHSFRSGPFASAEGIARIAGFHERQDRRYAAAAREASERHGKPILTASELAVTDRHYGNAGARGVREEGRICYPSAHRAIAALAAMCRYVEWRAREGA